MNGCLYLIPKNKVFLPREKNTSEDECIRFADENVYIGKKNLSDREKLMAALFIHYPGGWSVTTSFCKRNFGWNAAHTKKVAGEIPGILTVPVTNPLTGHKRGMGWILPRNE